MGYLIGIPFLVAIWAASAIYYGWMLSIMWGWFMVPLGLPVINVPWAIGIASTIGTLTKSPTFLRSEFQESSGRQAVALLIAPLVVLGIGWVAKQYM